MKSVLISIQPKWCELIANGKKTVEVRKTKPKLETPFKVYIYETKGKTEIPTFIDEEGHAIYQGRGQVIGEFICDIVVEFENSMYECEFQETSVLSCVDFEELALYLGKKVYGYGWHISNLVIYDKPRDLSEFVVEGDCLNGDCKKCKWFDGGNNYNVEADCLLPYDFNFNKTVKPLFRPPQSWCYVESEVDTE